MDGLVFGEQVIMLQIITLLMVITSIFLPSDLMFQSWGFIM
jgi:hypothetical protein